MLIGNNKMRMNSTGVVSGPGLFQRTLGSKINILKKTSNCRAQEKNNRLYAENSCSSY